MLSQRTLQLVLCAGGQSPSNGVLGVRSSNGTEVCLGVDCSAGCFAMPLCLGLPYGLLAFLSIAAILLTNY